MKKTREKWLVKGRTKSRNITKKEAHKIIRKKKDINTKVIESIEEDQKHNNTRKLYQTVNQFKKQYQHKFSIIRNKKGELAMNTKEKAEYGKNILTNY